MDYQFQTLAASRCRVGESPVWDARRNRLFWCDIHPGRIYCHSFDDNRLASWVLPKRVGSFGLTEDDRLVVAMPSGISLYDIETEALQFLVDPEPDYSAGRPDDRLNDGKVGPDGAFWVGSIHKKARTAALHRVLADGSFETKVRELQTSNGLAFSADAKIMIHTDSGAQWIDRYSFDKATGAIAERTRIASPSVEQGRPDGGAMDVAGTYWSAGVSAGCLNRYDMDGRLVDVVKVPMKRPTMPCFGGPDMRTLFVTSIFRPDDAGEHCGNVMMTRVEVPGVAVARFGKAAD